MRVHCGLSHCCAGRNAMREQGQAGAHSMCDRGGAGTSLGRGGHGSLTQAWCVPDPHSKRQQHWAHFLSTPDTVAHMASTDQPRCFDLGIRLALQAWGRHAPAGRTWARRRPLRSMQHSLVVKVR